MDIGSDFKKAGEVVRLLIIHSTREALAQDIVNLLRSKLAKEIKPREHRVASLKEMSSLPRPEKPYNIVLLIMHGDKANSEAWLFGDADGKGKEIGTNAALIKEALNGLIDDSLCIFGICHFGQDLLMAAIIDQGQALACLAPRVGSTITKSDIADEISKLINEIHARGSAAVNIEDLPGLIRKIISDDLRNRLVLYSAAGQVQI